MTSITLYCVAVTELLSLGLITIGNESFLNIEKFKVAAAVRVQAVSQRGLLSPTVARAAVAVAVFTLHHSLTRF